MANIQNFGLLSDRHAKNRLISLRTLPDKPMPPMPEPIAFFDNRFLPLSQLSLPVYDAGFVQGAAVSEQLRTFRGELFRLEQHLSRLARSMEIVGLVPGLGLAEFAEIARHVAENNHRLLDSEDDLGLSLFVTPGVYPTFAPPGETGATVCMHTYPLPFAAWAEKYELGQALATSDVEQVPAACWPAELKCRSRMHYYLADRQAAGRHPGARALLTDAEGYVVEASTANILVHDQDQGFVAPPRASILPGVSLSVLEGLAGELKIPFQNRRLTIADVSKSGEAMLCSTSSCVLPVASLNGSPIGSGRAGPVYRRMLSTWSELVGVDIRAQATRFAGRGG